MPGLGWVAIGEGWEGSVFVHSWVPVGALIWVTLSRVRDISPGRLRGALHIRTSGRVLTPCVEG